MTDANLIGQTIGNYRIDARLGSGGMGQVFRAHHIHSDRVVALKVMHTTMAADANFLARFRQEARTVADLHHPNLIEVIDFGEQDGRAYLVLEFADAGSLRDWLQKPGATLAVGLDLVRQAAEGLAFAHASGMVHRDIKPDNLLLTADMSGNSVSYTVKVGDFGLAKLAHDSGLTATGTTMGTPAYMSPEQCQGIKVDGRSDLYALGVVLFELSTGQLPFMVNSINDAVYQHVYTAPPSPRQVRPQLPPELDALILRCLAKRPEERFANGNALADALRALLPNTSPLQPGEGPLRPGDLPLDGTIYRPLPIGGPVPVIPTMVGPTNVPRLRVINAQNQVQQTIDLTMAHLTVGRAPANALVLNDPSVSRHHLRIDWDGRQVMVTDLGSQSGTLLGDTRLPAQVPQPWNWRTLLRIGSFWLRLEPPTPKSTSTLMSGGMQVPPGLASAALQKQAAGLIPGRIGVVLEQPTFTLELGKPTVVPVMLLNQGDTLDHISLRVEGVPADWLELPPPEQIIGHAQAPVALSVTVPQTAASRAGEHMVTIVGESRENPGENGTATAQWLVPAFTGSTLALMPSRAHGRRRGRYRVAIHNTGNAPAQFRLSAEDPAGTLGYTFAEEALKLEPGAETTVGLTVDRGGRLVGSPQNYPFTVQAQSGAEPVQTTSAQFIHHALLPPWLLGLLVVLVALGGGAALVRAFGATAGGQPLAVAVQQTPRTDQQTQAAQLSQAASTQQAALSAQQTAVSAQQTAVAEQTAVAKIGAVAVQQTSAAEQTRAAMQQATAQAAAAQQTQAAEAGATQQAEATAQQATTVAKIQQDDAAAQQLKAGQTATAAQVAGGQTAAAQQTTQAAANKAAATQATQTAAVLQVTQTAGANQSGQTATAEQEIHDAETEQAGQTSTAFDQTTVALHITQTFQAIPTITPSITPSPTPTITPTPLPSMIGNWNLIYDWGTQGTTTLTVNRDGTFSTTDGARGTWVQATLAVRLNFSGGTIYTGSINGDSMSGTMSTATQSGGRWTATRI